MFDLYRVEVRKILAQRLLAGLVFWIWPIGGLILPLVLLVVVLVTPPDNPHGIKATFEWTAVALGTWTVPTNLIGRLLFVALATTIFSGEYQWGTWKIIVPRADRLRLILAKYLAFASLVLLAFTITSVFLAIGAGLLQAARGMPYGPPLTADTLQGFGAKYVLQAVANMISLLIDVAFAQLIATLTRSLLGGVIGGLLFLTAELGLIAGVTVLSMALNAPVVANLGYFTSSLSVANISSWVLYGEPTPVLVSGMGTSTVAQSFLILIVWMVGLIGLNLWIFQRQDLT